MTMTMAGFGREPLKGPEASTRRISAGRRAENPADMPERLNGSGMICHIFAASQ